MTIKQDNAVNTSREIIRAKLAAAGKLSRAHHPVDPALIRANLPLLILPEGSRSSEDILTEDRRDR